MYFSTNDAIYFTTLAVLASCGALANAYLLYLVLNKSPSSLTPYRIFLGNTSATQLFLAIAIVLASPRILAEDLNIVVIYLGPIQLLGPWCSYMMYTVMLHLALNSFMSLMVSMIYRCIALQVSTISSRVAVAICLAGYMLPLSMVLLNLTMEYSADTALAANFTHYTMADMEKYAVVVTAKIFQPGCLWIIICCSCLLLPVYGVMYFCRWKILTVLNNESFAHSAHTKLNVERLVKALTIQSLVPSMSIFPPACAYLLIQFGVLEPNLLSYFIAPCLSIGPLLDPMITIYYVTPYRNTFTSVFLKFRRPTSLSTSPHIWSKSSRTEIQLRSKVNKSLLWFNKSKNSNFTHTQK